MVFKGVFLLPFFDGEDKNLNAKYNFEFHVCSQLI